MHRIAPTNAMIQSRQLPRDVALNVRAGIVGMGAISRHYVKAFDEQTGFDLVAVCDSNEQRLKSSRNSGLRVMQNFDDLLQLPDLDAVIICLPNDMHYSACKAAITAGMHVCCEKPLSFT